MLEAVKNYHYNKKKNTATACKVAQQRSDLYV